MTNEEIDIAIAEACGWKHYHEDLWVDPDFSGDPDGFSELQCGDLPDYLNDLNAMHEAEKVIKKDSNLWKTYESFLARIVSGDCGMFHITANQRAEAFLKTLGKWEE